MKHPLGIPRLVALVAVSAIGLAGCADDQTPGATAPSTSPAVGLDVSSFSATRGERIAVAVSLDAAPRTVGGVQGRLEFDASRLRFVGQSATGDAIAVANVKDAAAGSLRLVAGNPMGVSGRVAVFVFEAKADNWASSLRWVHQSAASAMGNVRTLAASTRGTRADASLGVPSDAAVMTVADWSARLLPAGRGTGAIAAAPGEYRLNLKYGDVNFDNAIDLNDFLSVANAAVGNDPIISNTDGPTVDVDLVIAGNVFPTNGGGACGTESDGSRVLDLNDFLAVANVAVGNPESCAGTAIPGRGPLATNRVEVSGNLTGTINWTKNNVYQLNGLVRVVDGATLNIEAGTRIEGNSAVNPSALYVERGAAIFAVGTQNEPIVFTCTGAKVPGCWGGVWISGKSTVNTPNATIGQSPAFAARTGSQAPVAADPGGCNQQVAEAGAAPSYGGCTPNDNSGRLSYVRFEYGGFVVAPNRELNNLTLAGVGSGTQVDHIQVHGGSDDGLEFFGGTVDVSYVVITANNDDGFDGSAGYTGRSQFVIIQNDAGDVSAGADSRAIEMDNWDSSNQNLPRTAPQLYNFTIIGNLVNRSSTAAIMLRRGTGPTLANSIVDGWPAAVSLRDAFTCSGFGTGNPRVVSTTFMDTPLFSASDNSGGNAPPTCAPATGTGNDAESQFLSLANGFRFRDALTGPPAVLAIDQILLDGRNTLLPDWRQRPSTPGGTTPIEGGVETVPAGLVQTNFRGAVGVLAAGQIPWYSGWTRPFSTPTTP
ncbi:MAG: hypothetical protein MUF53_12855 [Gemmatimonadaceae bacterium]|nr:hypothetical protein [Gemmatimonadaceae bacterium]